MKKEYFYTIMESGKFLNSYMEGMTDNITKAINFDKEEAVLDFFKCLRKERDFRIVEVECILREYEV